MFYVPPRLKELNFEVNVYDNYKQEEVLDIINQGEHARVQTEINVRRPVQSFLKNTVSPAAKADHSDVDCFMLVFLSHGENNHIYTYDDKINIQDITSLFKGDKCRSLVGKPKIFILQVGGALLKAMGGCECLG